MTHEIMNRNLEALGGWFGMYSCVCWCECGYGHMIETDGNAQISWFAAVCFVGVVYVTRQWPWARKRYTSRFVRVILAQGPC